MQQNSKIATQSLPLIDVPMSVFGVNSAATVKGLAQPHEDAPEINPLFMWTTENLVTMRAFFMSGDIGMYLTGHMGCGKSSLPQQWHARLGLPLLTKSCANDTDSSDLFGRNVCRQGVWVFEPGPVLLGAINGWSVLLDEANLIKPGIFSILNNLVEGKKEYIQDLGISITPRQGFRLFCTGNIDNGEGVYKGRIKQDGATDERFWFVPVGYLKPEEEKPVLLHILNAACKPLMADRLADVMLDVAHKVRSLFVGSSDEASAIEVTMSTRTLVKWAQKSILFQGSEQRGINPTHLALEYCLTNRPISPTTRATIHKLLEDKLGMPRNVPVPPIGGAV